MTKKTMPVLTVSAQSRRAPSQMTRALAAKPASW